LPPSSTIGSAEDARRHGAAGVTAELLISSGDGRIDDGDRRGEDRILTATRRRVVVLRVFNSRRLFGFRPPCSAARPPGASAQPGFSAAMRRRRAAPLGAGLFVGWGRGRRRGRHGGRDLQQHERAVEPQASSKRLRAIQPSQIGLRPRRSSSIRASPALARSGLDT
jgi:hypothetical protein